MNSSSEMFHHSIADMYIHLAFNDTIMKHGTQLQYLWAYFIANQTIDFG